MLADDPEAPTTTKRAVQVPAADRWPGDGLGGARSRLHPEHRPAPAGRGGRRGTRSPARVELPGRRRRRARRRGNSLAVMGPQLGYYYPEIVQQIDLHGPGINAQGAAVPGLAMYILIGRTPDYAWSLTSAGHDVRDVYAEELCEPDTSPPTRASTHYLFNGECQRLRHLQRRHARHARRSSTTSRCTAPCSPPPPSAGSRTPSRAGARRSAATASTSAR